MNPGKSQNHLFVYRISCDDATLCTVCRCTRRRWADSAAQGSDEWPDRMHAPAARPRC